MGDFLKNSLSACMMLGLRCHTDKRETQIWVPTLSQSLLVDLGPVTVSPRQLHRVVVMGEQRTTEQHTLSLLKEGQGRNIIIVIKQSLLRTGSFWTGSSRWLMVSTQNKGHTSLHVLWIADHNFSLSQKLLLNSGSELKSHALPEHIAASPAFFWSESPRRERDPILYHSQDHPLKICVQTLWPPTPCFHRG